MINLCHYDYLELIDASKMSGAVRKKDKTHRMAEANKAFAHFRFKNYSISNV